MGRSQFTALFVAAGLLVPVALRIAWPFIDQSASLATGIVVQKLMLVLWPTSLMTLPASPDSSFETKLFMFSVVANVVAYGILGALIWLGLRKHVSFLVIADFPLIGMWWWLLTR